MHAVGAIPYPLIYEVIRDSFPGNLLGCVGCLSILSPQLYIIGGAISKLVLIEAILS